MLKKIYTETINENKANTDSSRDLAKIILIISGGGVLLVGIYLGLKSLKK